MFDLSMKPHGTHHIPHLTKITSLFLELRLSAVITVSNGKPERHFFAAFHLRDLPLSQVSGSIRAQHSTSIKSLQSATPTAIEQQVLTEKPETTTPDCTIGSYFKCESVGAAAELVA